MIALQESGLPDQEKECYLKKKASPVQERLHHLKY